MDDASTRARLRRLAREPDVADLVHALLLLPASANRDGWVATLDDLIADRLLYHPQTWEHKRWLVAEAVGWLVVLERERTARPASPAPSASQPAARARPGPKVGLIKGLDQAASQLVYSEAAQLIGDGNAPAWVAGRLERKAGFRPAERTVQEWARRGRALGKPTDDDDGGAAARS